MYVTIRQVQCADTDSTGSIPLPILVRWMEETEYAFLRSRDLSVSIIDDKGQMGFPRTSVSIESFLSVQAFAWVAIELRLKNIDGKRIDYSFRVFQLPSARPQPANLPASASTILDWLPFGQKATPSEVSASVSSELLNQYPLIARGEFTVACCRFPSHQLPRAILIPDWIVDRLGLQS